MVVHPLRTPPHALRALTGVALSFVGIVLATTAPAAIAATAPCTAESVALSFTDRATFTWVLPTTLPVPATARVQVRADQGTGAWGTLSTTSVRTAGRRASSVGIAALAGGAYSWRVEITSGAVAQSCEGTAFAVVRPPSPAITLSGPRITSDGWRSVQTGQLVSVAAAPGDLEAGASWVRFQYATGAWSGEIASPATIPAAEIRAVSALRRTTLGMSGSTATLAVRTDSAAPAAPQPDEGVVQVGQEGGSVGIAASIDVGSGTGSYESSVVSSAGAAGAWAAVSGMRVQVPADAAGGTLRIRACDRVLNCSVSSVLRLDAARARVPDPTPVGSGPADLTPARPGTGASTQRPGGSAAMDSPRITSVRPGSPEGGAARVAVTLSRAADVTLSVTSGSAPVSTTRAWLGEGTTLVRIPAVARATQGTLRITATAGSVSATPVMASVRVPGGGRTAEAAVHLTHFRTGAQSILYDLDPAVREITRPADGGVPLTATRGALRQEPSSGHLFMGDADIPARVDKVSEKDIVDLAPDEIADWLRTSIENSPSHQIGIDEISQAAADSRAPMVVGAQVPPTDPSSFASRFAGAMQELEASSPYGGTWARRVHVYLAPAVTSALAAGRGPDHNLGRDRKPHFATYRTLMGGLAHAGAVWLEMYHGHTGAVTPFTSAEWKRAPAAVVDEYARATGDPARLHFLMAGSDAYPAGVLPPTCTTPQRCTWALADGTQAGRRILANGVGAYRLGTSARPWLAEWQARVG